MTARTRIRIETALAVASALFAVLALARREWIELIFRVGPDNGSGALEWGIALAALALAAVFAVVARLELRQLRATA